MTARPSWTSTDFSSIDRAGCTDPQAIAGGAGLQVRAVSDDQALHGLVDVVGCRAESGAVMVQVQQATGVASAGVVTVTDVCGDVARLEPREPRR